LREHERDRLPDAVFVQQTIDLATAEQLPGIVLCSFGYFHSGSGRFEISNLKFEIRHAVNCFSVSSASRR
jgi:hypothetical protein